MPRCHKCRGKILSFYIIVVVIRILFVVFATAVLRVGFVEYCAKYSAAAFLKLFFGGGYLLILCLARGYNYYRTVTLGGNYRCINYGN